MQYEEDLHTEVSTLPDVAFSQEYQPLGPIASHNYAVPYQKSEEGEYIWTTGDRSQDT